MTTKLDKLDNEALAQLRRDLKRMADGNERLMDGTTEPVKRIIEQADIVFGIWSDPAEPQGVGHIAIKGDRILREGVASQQTQRVKTTAMWCGSLERAVAAKQTLGPRELDA